ncbi:hypothetical protein RO3G_00793 [Rhizopus delemar RA 99-880]|uniref:Reverse transcriptase domain-containing protein n=1 Tax=Rhizopus delemar (strain RA 99-880 / ATCC MYA-4621 / FGSC 9543 / NRRL 43880) TaxID=246409 RepID=I1BIQ9_RHIO9|nr:hypothetical protein RO3G_00793 [Rhizopus delemar RA 99-880]|eukprot:EIE76089.1 hypothetical protein RO3G_00793 [Rhizopus delemar RA 99-880]
MSVFSHRISPCQMGFMLKRFIGEHGRLLHQVMTSASIRKSSAVGLLLDQEKAYDRVHPSYLSQVMIRFGVPPPLVITIIGLFFSINISININGFLTTSFVAQRGLRQGDPLSLLLFNIAFDPFLRLISSDPLYSGFSFGQLQDTRYLDDSPRPPSDDACPPPPVKILAYADDVLVFLHSPSDFVRLKNAVDIYDAASNAKLNFNKTQAFSLYGDPLPNWQQFLVSHNINSWHDRLSTHSLIYLGYPVYSSTAQRTLYVNQLTNKIALSCQVHSQRNLSIRSRVTVLNCLIFSRLWHVLQVLPLTKKQIATLQGLGSRFLNANSFPKISFATLSLPRSQGGLGALDPAVQIQALQWRWLLPMILSCSPSSPVDSLFPSVFYPSVIYGLYLLKSTTPQLYPNYQITSASSLLFPAFRSKHFSTTTLHCFSILFAAFDSLICRAFDDAVLSPTTILTIPLIYLIQATPLLPSHTPLINRTPPLPQVRHLKPYRQMLGSHIMIFDSSTLRLRYRTFTRTEIQHFTRTTKQVINLLTSNIIQLRTFAATHFDNPTTINNIVDHTTLILSIFNVDSVPNIPNQLLSPSPKISKTLLSSKKHNRLSCPCPVPQPPPTTHAPSFLLNSSKWSSFWRLDIPLRSRTMWFKIVHNSIPHTSFLHLCNIQRFLSPLCPLCLQEPNSLIHFFYICNKIQPVWIKISTLFIDNAWQYTIHHFLSDISAAVTTLSPSLFATLAFP